MNDPVSAAVRALLRRLHGQRPLRGGSLIVTLFGDAIAPRGGLITLGSLIRIAAPFRLPERLVRTSVGRLAQDGWLVARREGRQSEYRLTPDGERRFAQATRRIYGPLPHAWDGSWTLVIWPTGRRDRLREELRWLGFGQIGPGTFAHPGSTPDQARDWLANFEGAQGALCLCSRSEAVAIDRQLAAVGWDLGDLSRRYRRFVAMFEPVASAVRSAPALEPRAALIIRTLLIHEYRKVHLRDPLLPQTLLPADWIGTRAYELARHLYPLVFDTAEEFLSAEARTLKSPLPPADVSAYERFAGMATPPSSAVARRRSA